MLESEILSDTGVGKAFGRIIGRVKKGKKEETDELEEAVVPEMPTAHPIPTQIYLKAISLHSLGEIDLIKSEVKSGNILIIRISPLAEKSVEDVKRAVSELSEFATFVGGDVARLGEERVVLTPPSVKIWREKIPASGED